METKFKTINVNTYGNFDALTYKIIAAFKVNENNKLKIGFSFCSPKDRFSRIIGRSIAEARMIESEEEFDVSFWKNCSLSSFIKVLALVTAKKMNITYLKGVRANDLY